MKRYHLIDDDHADVIVDALRSQVTAIQRKIDREKNETKKTLLKNDQQVLAKYAKEITAKSLGNV